MRVKVDYGVQQCKAVVVKKSSHGGKRAGAGRPKGKAIARARVWVYEADKRRADELARLDGETFADYFHGILPIENKKFK